MLINRPNTSSLNSKMVHVTILNLGEILRVTMKGAEASYPKILDKNSNTLFFYSNLYLHFLKPYCENIFKIVCIVSENIGK